MTGPLIADPERVCDGVALITGHPVCTFAQRAGHCEGFAPLSDDRFGDDKYDVKYDDKYDDTTTEELFRMKIIGAGLPRTGTSSLKAALDRLGFGPTYHMFELMQNPEHVDRWRPVVNRESADWERVFAGYDSAVDFPASIHWRELAEAYPEAKVILSVRDPRRWHTSISGMGPQMPVDGGFDMAAMVERMPPRIQSIFALMPQIDEAAQRMLGPDFTISDGPMEEEKAVEIFERHTENVRAALPADRLLVFQATDGWGPLCEFLGVEVPVDEPYPHLNDAATLQWMFATMMETNELVPPYEPKRG